MVILTAISTYVSALKVALQRHAMTTLSSKKGWQPNKKIQTRSVDNNLLHTEYYYMAPLEIGTPSQKVLVSLDTGSPDLLLYGEDYVRQFPSVEPLYDFASPFNSSLSSTYTSKNTTFGVFFYDFRDSLTAKASTDTINFEGLTLEKQPFGFLVSGYWYPGPFLTGVMGLGFEYNSTLNATPPIQQLVFSKAFQEPVFTFALTRSDFISSTTINQHLTEEGGIFTIGEIDQTQYKGNIGWSPLISTISGSNDPSEWAVKLDNITVNGITLPEFEGLVAVFNTGMISNYVSNALFNTIFAQVQDSFLDSIEASDDPDDVTAYIPCGEGLAPVFNLTISMGGVSIPINPMDLIVRSPKYNIEGKDFCPTNLFPMKKTNVSLILGQYIFFSLFTVFSFDPPRIGIAELSDAVHNKGNQSNGFENFGNLTTSNVKRPVSTSFSQKALPTVPASATTHFEKIASITLNPGGSFAGGTLSMKSVTPSTDLPTSSNGIAPAITQATDFLASVLAVLSHLTVFLLATLLVL